MCGLTGYLEGASDARAEALTATVTRMADTIVHRGPDDSGIFVDPAHGFALGFRRLAIVDLTIEGHQPMRSACGRYVIAFNGEIYNYREIRAELEASAPNGPPRWRGHSDTEVMLEAIRRWGFEASLKRFNGMFAIALWDRELGQLHLARDRAGEKPLYYGRMGKSLLFGSELKALRAHPAFRGEIDRDALALHLRHGFIPAPWSIYHRICKLPPGTWLSFRADGTSIQGAPVPYWSLQEVAARAAADPFTGSAEEAVEALDRLLRDAVKLRMEADVPLGAFLSGGIDSSTVVALMQAQSDRPVRTFTIGFAEAEYNEAEHARRVAHHLGTDHTELYVTPEASRAVIPRLASMYDEPFADPSQIPTFLVSELARRHVTVSLSGDAGDELFAGYTRYERGARIWEKVARMPLELRRPLARGLQRLPMGVLEKAWPWLEPVFKRYGRSGPPKERLEMLAGVLETTQPERFYQTWFSHWKAPTHLVPGASEPAYVMNDPRAWADLPDFIRRMMYLDFLCYLPDDILVKVDRASMAVSLEGRVPLLDPRVIELAYRMPLSIIRQGGQGKGVLKQVLYRYVPQALFERPKQGFGVPIDHWLRGPLREWAEELLDAGRMRQEGYLEPGPIQQKWREHLAGTQDWQFHLWNVLMFQSWLRAQ